MMNNDFTFVFNPEFTKGLMNLLTDRHLDVILRTGVRIVNSDKYFWPKKLLTFIKAENVVK